MTVIVEQFQLSLGVDWSPRFNIAPTQSVLAVIVDKAGQRVARPMSWGLIPSWAKDPSIASSLINARSETVAEKPSFRTAFKKRRCLVIADGYYEWQKSGKPKQPFHIHLPNNQPFAMAGLWEIWGEGSLETCTLITTSANPTTQPIHDRMPVILDDVDYSVWLDPANSDRDQLQNLLRPYEGTELIADPITTYVNNVRHDDAGCLAVERPLF